MVRYPISRLLLSVHSTTPTPTITAEAATTMVPEYSDVVIVFTCLLCALICVVGVMGVVRWTCLKRPLPSMSSTNDVEGPPTECFKKIVESLPRLIFKSVDVADVKVSESAPTNLTLVSGEAECVICLSEFVDGDEIRMLPRCNHVFHVGCIDTWLIGSCSFCCPSCRQVLVVSQCHKCMADASVCPTPLSQDSQPQPEADYLP